MIEWQSDFELVRQFARQGRQPAFARLARRHLELVYATALRKVGDSGGAEEIGQNVFCALARKAWQFAPHKSLSAWLYKTALLESKSWLRGELRRRRREQTAAELGTTMKAPGDQPVFSALAALPLVWQSNQRQATGEAAKWARAQLLAAQDQVAALQGEVNRLRATAAKLEESTPQAGRRRRERRRRHRRLTSGRSRRAACSWRPITGGRASRRSRAFPSQCCPSRVRSRSR